MQVLNEHISDEAALARAGLSQDVGVLAPVMRQHAEELLAVPGEALADKDDRIVPVGIGLCLKKLVHARTSPTPRGRLVLVPDAHHGV